MSPQTSIEPTKRTWESPSGVQPGGGFAVEVDAYLGRVRRWLLRRFRPNYVRCIAGDRLGDCPGCRHDVLDPRDLRWCRNVCGYHFPEDRTLLYAPLRPGLARAGLAEIMLASVVGVFLSLSVVLLAWFGHWLFWCLLPVVLVCWFQSVYFFRDPERVLPKDAEALLSPADGRITHIEEVEDADFPDGRAVRVSIFLSVFNVHINRVPRSGKVVGLRYFRGCFLDARHDNCATLNEQLWLDLEDRGSGYLIRIKQISGAIARRIVCWLRLHEHVEAGERFGMIKFGSRTDVLVPAQAAFDVNVKVGDRVRAGSSVLLRIRSPVFQKPVLQANGSPEQV